MDGTGHPAPCARCFPLSARGSARQILQNILLPSPPATGCRDSRRRLALPTPSVPFLPPCSFPGSCLRQVAFEGAPGQVAESDRARDKSAAAKVGRRRELRAGTLTQHLPTSGWREEESRDRGLLDCPRCRAVPSSTSPLRWQTLEDTFEQHNLLPLCPARELDLMALSQAGQGTGTCPAGSRAVRSLRALLQSPHARRDRICRQAPVVALSGLLRRSCQRQTG